MDVVAIILAGSVLLVVVTFLIVSIIEEARGQRILSLSPGTAQVISDVVGSIVALLGAYIGWAARGYVENGHTQRRDD